jgi:putative inorganic carbon (hco3(-)) transporter
MLIACGGAAAALVIEHRRARLLAMAIALVAAPVLVLGDVWDEPRVIEFRESPAQVGGAIVVSASAATALVLLFRRFREAFPIAAFAVLPLRVPVEIGDETANLLVPLYLVIAAGVIASALGGDRAPPTGPGRDRWSVWLRRVLAATVVLYAVQAAYSEDVSNAIENIGFFLVPFAVLFALLAEVEWTRALLGRVLAAVAVVAGVCAVIAIYQWSARDLFLNPELFDSNQLHVYFRANSLFFDPNILGRYLALAITALGAYIAWSRGRRELALAALAAGLCLVGLAFSYSITSFAALLAGLGIVALLRWGWRGAATAGALGLAGLAGLAIAGGTPTSDIQDYRSIDSGRESLLEGGVDLFEREPLAGWGSGAFGQAFYEEIEPARSTISHSEPVTVAAEQGLVGLAVYAAFVVTALVVLFDGARGTLARGAVAACFVAMLVHSLGYAGFAIDPVTWALLGLGVALRRGPPDGSGTMPH